jgi:hypothetical protein
MIFVFGSNEAGHHGLGAAKTARLHHGAIMGQGFGPMGRSFGIPTKDWRIETLPVNVIQHYINRFIVCARFEPDLEFQVTAIGCGLAGLRHDVIAPLFKYAPPNCFFDEVWQEYLPKKKFWGTFP